MVFGYWVICHWVIFCRYSLSEPEFSELKNFWNLRNDYSGNSLNSKNSGSDHYSAFKLFTGLAKAAFTL